MSEWASHRNSFVATEKLAAIARAVKQAPVLIPVHLEHFALNVLYCLIWKLVLINSLPVNGWFVHSSRIPMPAALAEKNTSVSCPMRKLVYFASRWLKQRFRFWVLKNALCTTIPFRIVLSFPLSCIFFPFLNCFTLTLLQRETHRQDPNPLIINV